MRAAVPKRHQPDCEEKRDPDERQRPERKKENELDLNTQLERRPIIAPQISAVQLSHSGHSCEAQHSRKVDTHNADKLAIHCEPYQNQTFTR
jgi:hypothetical protein